MGADAISERVALSLGKWHGPIDASQPQSEGYAPTLSAAGEAVGDQSVDLAVVEAGRVNPDLEEEAFDLGLGTGAGDVVLSLGSSGTAFALSDTPTADASGMVAGFADATGGFLPLACTLNAARVLTTVAVLLGVDLEAFADLALSAPAGAGGLVAVVSPEALTAVPNSSPCPSVFQRRPRSGFLIGVRPVHDGERRKAKPRVLGHHVGVATVEQAAESNLHDQLEGCGHFLGRTTGPNRSLASA